MRPLRYAYKLMNLRDITIRAFGKIARIADPELCKIALKASTRGSVAHRDPVIYCSQYYTSKSPDRQREIDRCILHNSQKDWISNSIIFCDINASPPQQESVTVHNLARRLTYKTVFEWVARKNLGPESVVVLANSDILIPDNICMLFPYIGRNDFVALTRYESDKDKLPFLVSSRIPGFPSITQDTWIFKAKLATQISDLNLLEIPLGLPGCENRLVAILNNMNIRVSNPCLDIKTIHVHESNFRSYSEQSRIQGPYGHPKTMTMSQFCMGRRYKPRIDERELIES